MPHDEYFGRWQRARLRAQELVDGFTRWCTEQKIELPPGWAENEMLPTFTKGLADSEKAAIDIRKERDHDQRD